MNIRRHIKEAKRNLYAAKLRSFLAILGIVVGTGSVVALVSASQAATEHAMAQFKTLGTNLLALNIQADPQAEAMQHVTYLHASDLRQLEQHESAIEKSAPYISDYDPVIYKGHKFEAQPLGVTESLLDIAKIRMASGRFISELDGNSYYCVVGNDIAAKMLQAGASNVIGEQVKIGPVYFTVVGVMQPWQSNMFMFVNLNSAVITPLDTSYLLSKYSQIHDVLFRIKEGQDLQQVRHRIDLQMTSMLEGQHFDFRSPDQIIAIMGKQRSTFTWLLVMIGSISLLVGGIGVMNIMLVSVVERRREIGIRMAIGAKQKDIRHLFLVEAIVLTVFGGAVGIVVGVFITQVLGHFSGWGYHFYLLPMLMGIVVSVIVGVLSGYYPASKAAKLLPIDILR